MTDPEKNRRDPLATGLRDALHRRAAGRKTPIEWDAHSAVEDELTDEAHAAAPLRPRARWRSRDREAELRATVQRGDDAASRPGRHEAGDDGIATPDAPRERRPARRGRPRLRARLEQRLETYIAASAAELDARGNELLARAHSLRAEEERLAAAEASAAERARRLADLGADAGDGFEALVAQAEAREHELAQARGHAAELERRLEEHGRRTQELERRAQELAQREARIRADSSAERDALMSEVDDREQHLAKLTLAHAAFERQIETLEAELSARTRALDDAVARREREQEELDASRAESTAVRARLTAVEQELDRVRATTGDRTEPMNGDATAETSLDTTSVHLLFVPGPSGYSLVEREGPPPAPGIEVAVDGSAVHFVVTKVARSPLPGGRPVCAYLQAAR